jgi:hypothetical protein
VLEKLSDVSYRLQLPALMKVHVVFHVVKLKKFKETDGKFGPRVTGGKMKWPRVPVRNGDFDHFSCIRAGPKKEGPD